MIDLRLGDCLDVMRGIPDASIDAVITDPPYNVGIDYGATTDDKRIDYAEWSDAWFIECQRISKAILFTPGIGNLKMWLSRHDFRWIAAWTKTNSMKRVTLGFNSWEPILVWGKPRLNYYKDVIDAPIIANKGNGHPVPKPENLLIKMVKAWTDEGATVLDPFTGSGTTGVACVKLNRNFIGIEINPQYYAIAERRIQEAQAQMSMPMVTA